LVAVLAGQTVAVGRAVLVVVVVVQVGQLLMQLVPRPQAKVLLVGPGKALILSVGVVEVQARQATQARKRLVVTV